MSTNLYSIGEFSRMSGLPVKTLRFYHEKQLLTPAYVESDTGYRHYSRRNLETAQVIVALRSLEFGLDAITEILDGQQDEADILEFLERQKFALQSEIDRRGDIVRILDSIIAQENDARTVMKNSAYEIEEKQLEPVLVGGIRHQGRYEDCGKLFRQLGRKLGRHIRGKAMMLCYDEEYREEDADFEPCMPIGKRVEVEDINVQELPGGRCLSLIHQGPYESFSRSYCRIMEYAKEHELSLLTPSREVFLKGPGMIFKGNPEKYMTEIQFLVAE